MPLSHASPQGPRLPATPPSAITLVCFSLLPSSPANILQADMVPIGRGTTASAKDRAPKHWALGPVAFFLFQPSTIHPSPHRAKVPASS